MALGVPSDVRAIVSRVCARKDILDACRRRDLGTVIAVLNAHGVTPRSACCSLLWQSDLSNVAALRHHIEPHAWNDASLRWLVATSRQHDSETAGGSELAWRTLTDSARPYKICQRLSGYEVGGTGRRQQRRTGP